ncbi:MAG: sulfite exporter TauE/SafE family protein [bacterium]
MNSELKAKERVYYVRGMHCASCEILIEKKLLEMPGVLSVDSNTGKGRVLIECDGSSPSAEALNKIFKKENYVFSDSPLADSGEGNNILVSLSIAALFIVGFLIIRNSGLAGLVNVGSKSSLPTFFVFGVLAGVSSCAALVGGLVLSMSKQWFDIYPGQNSTWQKLNPHLMFNIGRLLSYGFLGAILGLLGSQLKISLSFTSLLIMAISLLMLFLGLQMLGIQSLKKFQLGVPKFISRYIADEKNFKGRWMPALMGALTFFLPCGFTITAQGLALLSGNALQGGLIMFFFALGTAPTLLLIGLSSVKFSSRPHLAYQFLKVAGFLILFFALFNINSQLNLLGWTSFNDLFGNPTKTTATQTDQSGLPPIINGQQVIKMDATSYGYTPNYFKVRTNVPVRWEVTDKGSSGCTNAVISKGLFADQIPLTNGQVSVKEFTPTKTGKYKFSCWMGMISGMIEVVN